MQKGRIKTGEIIIDLIAINFHETPKEEWEREKKEAEETARREFKEITF